MRRAIAAVLVVGMMGSPAGVPLTAVAQQGNAPLMTIHANVDRVLTNVVVRDKKTGALIKDLKETDFQVLEDKKPQKVTTFDYQDSRPGGHTGGKCHCLRYFDHEEEDHRRPGQQ